MIAAIHLTIEIASVLAAIIKTNKKGYFLSCLYSAPHTIEFFAKPTYKQAEHTRTYLDDMFEKNIMRSIGIKF